MSHSRFLNCILTEGLLMIFLSLCILILPKISHIAFGDILSFVFITYGGYKVINGYLTRHLLGYTMLNIISGSLLLLSGIMLLFGLLFQIELIISALAVYFIISALSLSAFAYKTKEIIINNRLLFLTALLKFVFGLITIAILPSYAFWISGLLAGLDLLISGCVYTNLYYSTKT